MKRFTVYALADPRTALPLYVGITSRSAMARLIEHRCHSSQRRPELGRWIAELDAVGLAPTVLILEQDPPDGMNAEKRWIGRLRKSGAKLFNVSDGGQGPNGTYHTESWKRQISRANTGKKLSDATKALIADSIKGKARPDLANRNKAGATLSDEQVVIIRQRLALGEKGAAIANEFGISKALVSLIKNNKRRS